MQFSPCNCTYVRTWRGAHAYLLPNRGLETGKGLRVVKYKSEITYAVIYIANLYKYIVHVYDNLLYINDCISLPVTFNVIVKGS